MTAMMDATATTTVSTFTVNGKGELVGMLADLALTADKGKAALEPLTVIRLHTEGGRLHGWSTDRYRAAHAAVDTDDGELFDPVNIGADDVDNLWKTFRQALKVTVTVDTEKMTAEFAGGGVGVTVPLRPMSSPNLGEMLPRIAVDTLPDDSKGNIAFSPVFLETFAKVGKRRKEHVRMVAAATDMKPSHFQIGADYRAWLMPLRPRDGEAAGWLPSVF
jgi:hypothetical protein